MEAQGQCLEQRDDTSHLYPTLGAPGEQSLEHTDRQQGNSFSNFLSTRCGVTLCEPASTRTLENIYNNPTTSKTTQDGPLKSGNVIFFLPFSGLQLSISIETI